MVKGAMCCSFSTCGGLLVRIGAEAQERMLGDPHERPIAMAGRSVTSFIRVLPGGYRSVSWEMDTARGRFFETLGGEKWLIRSQRDMYRRSIPKVRSP
jgi:hypothetical protein